MCVQPICFLVNINLKWLQVKQNFIKYKKNKKSHISFLHKIIINMK